MNTSSPVPQCRFGAVVRRGRVIIVKQDVDPQRIARAIRRVESGDSSGESGADDERGESAGDTFVSVDVDPAPAVYEHIGYIHSGMGLRIRTALAAAARTRNHTTPYDEELCEARDALEQMTTPLHDHEDHRRHVAAAATETERLREAVATARGRLLARRENDLDPTPAADELAEAIAELSDAETTEAAARQTLERARTEAQERRQLRDRRFRLEDRVANLERSARAHLVDEIHESYVRTLADVPGASGIDTPYEVEPVTGALAIARLTRATTPVVLECDRFDSPQAAYNWLDVPILWI